MATFMRKVLLGLKWCITIALLFGVAVFCIAYVINAVQEACRAGVWSQQQENEQTMRMFGQQE